MTRLVRKRIASVPTEHQEQSCLFARIARELHRWPELRFAYAVPNGAFYGAGGRLNFQLATKMRAEGLKRGVPDVVVPIVIHCGARVIPGLYVELKRRTGGRLAPEQVEYRDFLRSQGYVVEICMGWEAAWSAIAAYLESGALANRVAA